MDIDSFDLRLPESSTESAELEYDFDEDDDEEGEATSAPRPDEAPVETEEEKKAKALEFTNMLLDKCIDPFRPWVQIIEELKAEPAFLAVASAKDREALFLLASPELAERTRQNRRGHLEKAKEEWAATLAAMTDLAKLPPTWTEYSRQLRKAAPWFRLLDAREMEKQYRVKLKHLKDVAVTYNVKSNN